MAAATLTWISQPNFRDETDFKRPSPLWFSQINDDKPSEYEIVPWSLLSIFQDGGRRGVGCRRLDVMVEIGCPDDGDRVGAGGEIHDSAGDSRALGEGSQGGGYEFGVCVE